MTGFQLGYLAAVVATPPLAIIVICVESTCRAGRSSAWH